MSCTAAIAEAVGRAVGSAAVGGINGATQLYNYDENGIATPIPSYVFDENNVATSVPNEPYDENDDPLPI